MYVGNCLICSKHRADRDIAFRNDFVVVRHLIPNYERNSNYLGYYMVESARHFKGLYNSTEDEAVEISLILRKLSIALMKISDAAQIYTFVLGEGSEHFHIHVITRYKNAPKEYWGAKVDGWPEAPRGGITEIRKLNEFIKKELLMNY